MHLFESTWFSTAPLWCSAVLEENLSEVSVKARGISPSFFWAAHLKIVLLPGLDWHTSTPMSLGAGAAKWQLLLIPT